MFSIHRALPTYLKNRTITFVQLKVTNYAGKNTLNLCATWPFCFLHKTVKNINHLLAKSSQKLNSSCITWLSTMDRNRKGTIRREKWKVATKTTTKTKGKQQHQHEIFVSFFQIQYVIPVTSSCCFFVSFRSTKIVDVCVISVFAVIIMPFLVKTVTLKQGSRNKECKISHNFNWERNDVQFPKDWI
jgi:hypothetical protein